MHQPEEEFRPVVGHEGRYEVSNLGRVRSLPPGRPALILRPAPRNKFGHLAVALGHPGKSHWVHALVLEAFVGPRPPGAEARHDPDPAPSNNRLDNLRWGTRSDNIRDAVRHGTWNSEKRIVGRQTAADKIRGVPRPDMKTPEIRARLAEWSRIRWARERGEL